MPINKITAGQFADRLNQNIIARNNSYDIEVGFIPDVIVQPDAQILETQNDRLRTVSQLISLDDSAVFNNNDIEKYVFNELLLRNEGTRAVGTVIFSKNEPAPSSDLPVSSGFPIATQSDESTGETVVFITTESKTLPAAFAASYFNTETNKYELEVAIRATVTGSIGEVGPNRITRTLRPLVGFDTVFNRNRTSVTTDRETNNDLAERYRIAIRGTQLGTLTGLKSFLLSEFPATGDILPVPPNDPLVTRAGSGAIDVFVLGSQTTTRVENQEFIGFNQLIILDEQPVTSITTVKIGSDTYTAGTHFNFVKDTSGNSGSIRAQDGIEFIPFTSTPPAIPSAGQVVNITYVQNSLIETMQNELDIEDNDVGGQDRLIRESTQIDVEIAANLVVLTGFGFSIIQAAVEQAILNYINTLKLGQNVERSDIQAVVRGISGVDNFVFTVFDLKGGSGVDDITIESNKFARLDNADLSIT